MDKILRLLTPLVLFLSLLLAGLSIYRDYGVHWDELRNQNLGKAWGNYALNVLHDHSLSQTPLPDYSINSYIHGPVLALGLFSLKQMADITDSRDVIFMNHLVTFLLFFLGVVFFYLLCVRIFQNWKLSLLGCIFLVLSPRIFAAAFCDALDIGFLSVFIICTYTMFVFLERKTFLSFCLHALTCALLMDIRQTGLILVLLTCLFLIQDKNKKILLWYVLLTGALIVLFCPLLWTNPIGNFLEMLITSMTFKNSTINLFYTGQKIFYQQAPWFYAPLWIVISTPPSYVVLFFIGCAVFMRSLTKRHAVFFLACFFLPLVLAKGHLYGTWRHVFFIYPAFLIFTLAGLQFAWEAAGKWKLRAILGLLIIFDLIGVVRFMVLSHPYQNVYFNRLAGKDLAEVQSRFEIDQFRLSIRQGLEYILKNDPSPKILINEECRFTSAILPYSERTRFVYAKTPEKIPAYSLFVIRKPKLDDKEIFSVKVDGAKILYVYKTR